MLAYWRLVIAKLEIGVYTEEAEAWYKVAKTVEDYSEEMIEQWIKEIDGLLTFVCSF